MLRCRLASPFVPFPIAAATRSDKRVFVSKHGRVGDDTRVGLGLK